MLNKDYKEMLEILLRKNVRFLIVGAYALGVHGYPRATGDLDIWVEANPENAAKLYDALCEFGAPKDKFSKADFEKLGVVYQIGVVPCRIDILTRISGVSFAEAWGNHLDVSIEGLNIPVLGLEDLLKNKASTAREKDELDLKLLKNKK